MKKIYCVGFYCPVIIRNKKIVTQVPLLTVSGMSVHPFIAIKNELINHVKEN